ncbi:MAG TPA: hypothetical protein VH597_17525 [Verrucomicrobiae bacterium]|jgi:hypothetical protein|nr:hypothetical protein [Verrucomicrobiae bacterium]
MSNNICLATNYLQMTEVNRQMWIDFDRYLDEFGCRLVLFSTAVPDDLPFAILPHPYLIPEYAQRYPNAVYEKVTAVSPKELDWLEADAARALRPYPISEGINGLNACRNVWSAILRTLQPGFVMVADNTLCQTSLVHEMCRESDIPSVIYERGLLPETLMVESRGILGQSDMRTHWLAHGFSESACDDAAFEQIRGYYLAHRPQKYAQPGFGSGGAELREKWGLGKKKVVVCFGHYDPVGCVPVNGKASHYNSPGFRSTPDLLMALQSCLGRDPNIEIVFKQHPIDPDPYTIAKLNGIRVVYDVNVHALIDLADVVVTQFTTLQFETVLYDKPVVLAGRSAWWGRNAAYEVKRPEDLHQSVYSALNRVDWPARRKNARAFITTIMERWLIGCNDRVPTRRNLRDFAKFVAETSLDANRLPAIENRWEQTEAVLESLRPAAPAPLTMSFSKL